MEPVNPVVDVPEAQAVSKGKSMPNGSALSNQNLPKKIKTKVDGIEEEVDLDELIRERQKYRASDKRLQEASQLRKEAQQERATVNALLERAQQGDLSWLKGLVPQEMINAFAEQQLLEHINWEKMPESERRAIQAERKAKELESKISEITQTKEREEASKIEEQAYQSIERDIVNAVKNLGYDVKVTPRFIRRIAEQVHASIEASEDPQNYMPASVASKRAFNGLKVDAKELLSILKPEEAIELLPDSLKKWMRQSEVQNALKNVPMRMRERVTGEKTRIEPTRRQKEKRMGTDDWFAKMDKRLG